MIIGRGETSFADFCPFRQGNNRGEKDREKDRDRNSGDETKKFKSKNLDAERKRRQKLSDRLLELRSLVPNITNMNKATIITDAITYIEELQGTVRDLSDQLYEMDASLEGHLETQNQIKEKSDNTEEMKKWGIKPEVQVTHIDGKKLWIHIVCQKKIGAFSKLMEAFSTLGFEPMDNSVTTSKGSLLLTSCVDATHCRLPEMDQIKDFLIQIVASL